MDNPNNPFDDPSTSAAVAVERFRAGMTSRGPMLQDYLNHPAVKGPTARDVVKWKVYEFPWGFVTESTGFGGFIWDLYVQAVWQSGTERWWDRFLTAHHAIVAQELERAYHVETRAGFIISFDDGISNYSAASYGCMTPEHAVVGRAWFTDRFLRSLWPEVLRTALDPEYKFAVNWYCS